MAEQHHTPINVKDVAEHAIHPHMQTIVKSRFSLHIDKYTLIFLGSIGFFVASLSFWSYVTFYMK